MPENKKKKLTVQQFEFICPPYIPLDLDDLEIYAGILSEDEEERGEKHGENE